MYKSVQNKAWKLVVIFNNFIQSNSLTQFFSAISSECLQQFSIQSKHFINLSVFGWEFFSSFFFVLQTFCSCSGFEDILDFFSNFFNCSTYGLERFTNIDNYSANKNRLACKFIVKNVTKSILWTNFNLLFLFTYVFEYGIFFMSFYCLFYLNYSQSILCQNTQNFIWKFCKQKTLTKPIYQLILFGDFLFKINFKKKDWNLF